MSSFTEPLEVVQVDGKMWRTTREFEFYHDAHDDHERQTYRVMEGFLTDFASIPRIVWPVIGHPAGEYAQAGVLHDFLYRTQPVNRAEADALFLEAMGVLGVAKWKRRVMWAAVRVFGRNSWLLPI